MWGFGFFSTKLGMGTYNKERQAAILRSFSTDKDALWGDGLRVPIGNRLARAAAALTWGTITPDKPAEDTVLLSDCVPHSAESYDAFAPDAKKLESRGKTPQTVDMFVRAAKQQVLLFALFFGKEHSPGRLEVISIFHQIHGARPEVLPLHFPISTWEAMTYRYISEVVDGTRRLLRMLPDNVRKTEYRRKASAPGVHGRPRWEFPTTWLMDHHTGYWLSIAIPKIEERISKSTWAAVLHQAPKPFRAAGEALPDQGGPSKGPIYPAGMPHPIGRDTTGTGTPPAIKRGRRVSVLGFLFPCGV